MKDCTFCQIFRDELPSSRVFADDCLVALLDIRPMSPGHTLLIPRRHVSSFTDLSAKEVELLALMAQRVASALKTSAPQCEGISLSLADGEAAGQEVPHAHLHVIPRRAGDGLGLRLPASYGHISNRSELDEMAARIRDALK